MSKLHGFHQHWTRCETARDRYRLLLQILEENLAMSRTTISRKSGYDKSTISHYANDDTTGGEVFADTLRRILDDTLGCVRLLGTCAPVEELDPIDASSVQLELLTVMMDPTEAKAVQFPSQVAGAWGTIGTNDATAFVLVVDPALKREQADVIAHELEELAAHLRSKYGTRNPPNPNHKADW
jgi:hypothetical protein